MAPVYSTRLLAVRGHTGLIEYTVPAGYVAVLRDLDAYVNADLSGAINLFLVGHLGQTIFWSTTDIDTTTTPEWRGRQVIEAGETFGITSDGPVDVTVSGYLLSSP